MRTHALDEACNPAEIYDAHFVPALFAHWGPVVAADAGVRKGERVLDVACGTGALTLAVAEIVGPPGSVVGLDVNPQMLAVARRQPARIEWLEGKAEALPLTDTSFDAVVSQFGLMFFEDKPQALREMIRVLRSGGRLAVAVCDAVENSPGYNAFALLLDRLFGKKVGDAFRAPFSLGNVGRLHEICRDEGIWNAEVARRKGKVGSLDQEQLRGAAQKSNEAIAQLAPDIQWVESHVAADKTFCVYLAKDEAVIRRHAEISGFPGTKITEISKVIDPTTAAG
jgi:SAM-dependent methyltransferase